VVYARAYISARISCADRFCLHLSAVVFYDAAIQAHEFPLTITRRDARGARSESGGTSTDATAYSVQACERCAKPGIAPLFADIAVGAVPYANLSSGRLSFLARLQVPWLVSECGNGNGSNCFPAAELTKDGRIM
jgi:hypothetical protein